MHTFIKNNLSIIKSTKVQLQSTTTRTLTCNVVQAVHVRVQCTGTFVLILKLIKQLLSYHTVQRCTKVVALVVYCTEVDTVYTRIMRKYFRK